VARYGRAPAEPEHADRRPSALVRPGDFVDRARELAREKGMPFTEAADRLASEEPELHAAYVARCHAEHAERRRRA
jgi:hypothetical protein